MQTFGSKLRSALRASGCEIRQDISGCSRRMRLEIFPRQLSEVTTALKAAQRFNVKIQAVSCGRNWGFGSGLPASHDCLLVNLSGLNRIREMRLSQHVVEVEPGVTQGQLADELVANNDSHFHNVTGAGLSTSVLGNALERGIGYFGSRESDLVGAEILLPNGEIARLGYGAHSSAHGAPLGPALQGLFVQSGWGLVTAGTFRLRKKSDLMGAVVLEIANPIHLPWIINRLGSLLSEGWLSNVPHIFNQLRLETTFGGKKPWPAWLAVLPIQGPRMLVKALVDELKRQFSPRAAIKTLRLHFPEDDCGPLDAISPLLEGKPIDLALFSMAKTLANGAASADATAFDPELGTAGLIHVTPSCALDDFSRLLFVVKKSAATHGWGKLPLSFNLVTERHGCLVISICFKRRSAIQKAAARNFATDLLRQCTEADFQPYRLGLEQAEELMPFDPVLARLCQRIHTAMDPDSQLAPSRYSPLWNHESNARELPSHSSFLEMIENQQLRTERAYA